LADDGEPKEAVIEESDVDSQITASDMAAEDTADGAITGGVEGSAEASLETYGNGKFFKGFAAFVLFGPLAPESEQSDLFKFQDFLKPSENRKRKREELETLSKEMLKPRQVKNKALQGLVKTVAPDSYVDLCGDDDGNKKPKAKMNPQSRPSSCMSSCPSSPTASETE
jgi:hypothetical protein